MMASAQYRRSRCPGGSEGGGRVVCTRGGERCEGRVWAHANIDVVSQTRAGSAAEGQERGEAEGSRCVEEMTALRASREGGRSGGVSRAYACVCERVRRRVRVGASSDEPRLRSPARRSSAQSCDDAVALSPRVARSGVCVCVSRSRRCLASFSFSFLGTLTSVCGGRRSLLHRTATTACVPAISRACAVRAHSGAAAAPLGRGKMRIRDPKGCLREKSEIGKQGHARSHVAKGRRERKRWE